MTVFALNRDILSKPQVYTAAQAQKQIGYLDRKRIARPFAGSNRANAQEITNKVWQQVCQARDTPCSVGTFQKFKRLHSEARLGRAALDHLVSLNLPIDEASAILEPGNASEQTRADLFWKEFANSEIGRSALNSTDFLDSHIDLSIGLPAKIALYAGRLSRDLADIWLARTTILATSYRSLFDKQAKSGSLFHSALYAAGAMSLISFLAVVKTADIMTLPARVLVFSPVYFAAAGLKLLGKAADSLAFRLTKDQSVERNQVIRDIAKNRALEQLAGIAKLQNLMATPGSLTDASKHMAQHYAQEQATFQSANTLTRVISKTVGQIDGHKRQIRKVIGDPREVQSRWAKALLQKDQSDTAQPSTIMSVLSQLRDLDVGGKTGTDVGTSPLDVKLAKKIRYYKFQAMAGAVKVFVGPRAAGLFNDTVVCSEQADRHFKSREVKPFGVNPFPDRVARESWQKLITLAFGRMKYGIAVGLSNLAGADLKTSAYAMKLDSRGLTVSRFNPLQKALQKTARLISMNSVGDKAVQFHDAIPLTKKWGVLKATTPSEMLCKTKRYTQDLADQRYGSLADAQSFPQSYSPLTRKLARAQNWVQKNAERALQPARGNTGRAIDQFFTKQLITRGLDSGLSSDLSHGASIVLWGGIGIGTAPFFAGYPAILGTSISAVTLGLSAGLVALSIGLVTQGSILVSGRKGFVPAMSLNQTKVQNS